jgi:hypothetical protein
LDGKKIIKVKKAKEGGKGEKVSMEPRKERLESAED